MTPHVISTRPPVGTLLRLRNYFLSRQFIAPLLVFAVLSSNFPVLASTRAGKNADSTRSSRDAAAHRAVTTTPLSPAAVPSAAGQILLKPTPLARDRATNEIIATVNVTNGQDFAADIRLTKATLRNLATGATFNGAPVPQPMGMMSAGASANAAFRFAASAGGAGAEFMLSVSGSYTGGPVGGGTFNGSFRLKAPPQSSRVYTTSADFGEGSLINVVHSVADQLQLDDTTRAFNFIWVAVSSKGTVVKIDTETGAVLGEYRTAPQAQPINPSRTTVDHNGNVWTANRDGNSVVRVGLLENGQCVDRNGNGRIDTSGALGDVREWPNAGEVDTDGGVDTAADECILNYVRVNSSGTRHVSVNKDNDVWVSGTGGRQFDLIDGRTGLIKRSEPSVGYGGYGGLIDKAGVIWSAAPLLRWDTSKPLAGPNGGNWRGYDTTSYGLCIDSKGNVWNTHFVGARVEKFAPDGTLLGAFQHGSYTAQGCVVGSNDDVWIAHSLHDPTVGHLKNDGTFVGNVNVSSGPTGVAVDARGKIWSTNHNSGNVSRIDPNAGPVGADGLTRVGESDFTTPYLGGQLYNYSDMTGSTLSGAPGEGTWSTVYDSKIAGAEWGRIGWTARVCGDGALSVTVASGEDGTTFGQPESVTSGADPSVANGRYLKINVSFRRAAGGESPVLYDLSVGTLGFTLPAQLNSAPSVNAGADQTVTFPEPATLHGSVCDDSPPAGTPLALSWEKVGGPGGVAFSNVNSASPTVTFSAPGTYVLRLTGGDGANASSDEVTVVSVRGNQSPVADAGPDETITLPDTADLNGTVSDDGLPAGGSLTSFWSKVSGPGAANFADPNAAATAASFTAPGTYVLRLTASDTELSDSDEVTITVNPPAAVNQPPAVNAGPDQAVNLLGTPSPKGNIVVNHDEWTISNEGFDSAPDAAQFAQNLASFFTGGRPGRFLAYSSNFGVTNEQFVSTLTGAGHTLTVSTGVDFSLPNLLQYDGVFLAADHADNAVLINYVKAGGNVYLALGTGVGGPFAEAARWNTFLNAFDLNARAEYNLISGVFPVTSQHPVFAGVGGLFYGNGQSVNRFSLSDPHAAVLEGGFFAVYQTRAQAQLNGVVADDGLPAGSAPATSWSKVSGPGAVIFEDDSAAVTTAAFGEPGSYVLRLTADDSQLSRSDDVLINVNSPAVINQAPVVDAGPEQTVALHGSAALSGAASDDGLPQGSSLTFQWSKVSGPGTVTFGSPSQPTSSAAFGASGTYVLQLQAGDTQLTSADTVVINVNSDNHAPTVNAGPDQISAFGDAATLSGTAADDGRPAGGTLNVSWTKVSGPGAVSFGNAGQPATTATFSAGGLYVLRLAASDSQLTSSDDISVTVNRAPVVNAGPDQTITLPSAVTLSYTVGDDGLPAGRTNVSWTKASGPGDVSFGSAGESTATATFGAAGAYVLRLSADDTHLNAADEVTVTVNPAEQPPAVSILSPADESTLTTRTDVMGSVSGGAWRLEYSPTADEGAPTQWTAFAAGVGAVSNARLGVFDPTLLLNGHYLIRLTATGGDGQTSSASVGVVVSEEQKVGNFTISFSDLSTPVAGLPIEVVRTYDSRDKRQGDFGVGWTLGIRNVRVQESRAMGAKWLGEVSPGFVPTYCVTAARPHVVTVTVGDSRVYKFEAVLTPGNGCQLGAPLREVTIGFRPLPGTNASLAVVGAEPLLVPGPFPGAFDLLDGNTVAAADYDQYQLTLEDGTALIIDQRAGLQRMTDTNGNTLTITPGGVIHSSGKSITFTRDAQGRITQITDPSGNAMTYAYDANGDLASFKDRENNSTAFTYNSTHGLLTIKDPRGLQPLRNEYDAGGRLVRQVDAFGKEVNFTHDLDARQETTFDRLGRATVYDYDARGNVVRVQDADGKVTTRTYDARDNLLAETNALGKTSAYTYDAQDNRLSETDALGNKTQYTYNSRGQVLTTTDPAGGVTTYTYDLNGNQTAVKDALGHTTGATYSANGLQLTSTDALNNTTSFEYDANGNLTRQTDPLGNVTTYTYDLNGDRLSESETRAVGGATETLVTSYEHDKLGRQTKVNYPDGSSTQTLYNSIGKQEATVDQLGRRTSYEYDAMGQLVSTTYPDNTKEATEYDFEGRRAKSVDREGRATAYAYDLLGRLEKTTFPDASTTSNTYDAAGQLITTTDALGHVTRYEYDAAGRRTKVINALGHETAFGYDANGNQTSATDAKGRATRYVYDAANRRTQVIFPDNTTQTTAYDVLGQVKAKTDQAGIQTGYEYDKRGKLTEVADALGGVTRYGYDEQGNQLTQTDANNHTTLYGYDRMGRRTKRTLPLGMSETYAYDLAGNLTSRTDFRGKTTTFAHDSMNRVLRKTPDASLAEPAVTFTYTATGRRKTMTDASGPTTYTYDTRDRPVGKETPQGTLSYAYDLAGNVKSIRSSNANGVTVNYSYDELNRLSNVVDNSLAAGTTAYAYDLNGNLESTTYPNAVRTSYTFDSLNRLKNVNAAKGSTLANYAYTLGAAGNRLSVTEAGGRTTGYAYDALYRLTGETASGDTVPANNGTINYTYDAVGNRLNRASTVGAIPATTSTYDANDRLTSDAYDPNGNTTASNGTAYQYDSENRLTSLNGGAVTYVYDGDGNRVARTSGGVTTRYLVDTNNHTGHAQVVEELINSSVRRTYTYGHDLISQTQVLNNTRATHFYGYDGHGSTRYLTDTAGTVTDTYTYDAFGNLIARTGTTPNDYLYAGEQLDSNLGFYYLRARYMNPYTGRFRTQDSYEGNIFKSLSLHKYVYAHDDPVNLSDPSGRIAVAGDQVGAIPLSNIIGAINFQSIISVGTRIAVMACGARLITSFGPGGNSNTPCEAPSFRDKFEEITVYRHSDGKNPGSFRIDADGLSAFETPSPDRKFNIPFRVKYLKPKRPGTPAKITQPSHLNGVAQYTPQHGPGHWSLRFRGYDIEELKDSLSEYAKDILK
jgi:RHS repeat-associated protein